MEDFWNQRYMQKEMAYGEEPNVFFAKQLNHFTPGKMLLPAEGEGRNAVYAAKKGWEAFAFDISKEGKTKAHRLAKKNNCTIHYELGKIEELSYESKSFDCLCMIYAHVDTKERTAFHRKLSELLKVNGIIIFEAFSKAHLRLNTLDAKVGGPKKVDMLYSIEEIKKEFSNYEIILLEEKEVMLNEGLYHNGKSSVIRFVGKKSY